MEQSSEPLVITALVKDLMFSGKIGATARAHGRAVSMVRSAGDLRSSPGGLLLADLSVAGAVEASAEWKKRTGGRVVGFVSHVDAETIVAARAAGLDEVLARSAFAAQLESLLGSR